MRKLLLLLMAGAICGCGAAEARPVVRETVWRPPAMPTRREHDRAGVDDPHVRAGVDDHHDRPRSDH
jgi:hypothetical protein